MNSLRGRSSAFLLASLLAVTVAWWGCGGGGEQADGETGGGTDPPGPEGDGGGEAPVVEVSLETGKATYLARCALCHGDTGKGDGPAGQALDPQPRDHTDATYMDTLTDADIIQVVSDGKGAMPPHKDLLSEVELESVVMYVRSLSQS